MEQGYRSKILVVVLGLLIGTSAVVVAKHDWRSSATLGRQGERLGILDPNEPLGPYGALTTLSNAVGRAPVPVYRPETNLASDQTIAGIWVRSIDTPEVFIRYASGVEVSTRPADFTNGFENFYTQEINNGQAGVLTTIDAVSVYVTPGHMEGTEAPWADFVLNKMLVEVVGTPTLTQDDVTSLVDSIIRQSSVQA